jgi:hypothetical protein
VTVGAASWPGWACIALGVFVLLLAGRSDSRGRYDYGDYSWVSNLVAELSGPIMRVFYGFIGGMLIVAGIVIVA